MDMLFVSVEILHACFPNALSILHLFELSPTVPKRTVQKCFCNYLPGRGIKKVIAERFKKRFGDRLWVLNCLAQRTQLKRGSLSHLHSFSPSFL